MRVVGSCGEVLAAGGGGSRDVRERVRGRCRFHMRRKKFSSSFFYISISPSIVTVISNPSVPTGAYCRVSGERKQSL